MGKTTHERFDRMEWAFKHDFTGALAKCLVKQSPYTVPNNLEKILADFHERIPYDFDSNGMAEVSLATMTETMNTILESMPDVMALNERKNGREGMGFSSRFSVDPEPDDDFIDIMAVAQNITCEFAERSDAECWLDRNKTTEPDRSVLSKALRAICLTRDYVGEKVLPPIEGWEWFDAGKLISELIPEDEWAEQFKLRTTDL